MNPYPARIAWLAATATFVVVGVFWFLHQRKQPDRAPAEPAALLHAPAKTLPPAEIFRRAFWRQPTDADRILHAERRETRESERNVARWQWFLAVRPSADLLKTLRDPATFGLSPVASGAPLRHWPTEPQPAPTWFPAVEKAFDYEVLQSPETGLTVLYQAKGNLLYATDTGSGFAAPVR